MEDDFYTDCTVMTHPCFMLRNITQIDLFSSFSRSVVVGGGFLFCGHSLLDGSLVGNLLYYEFYYYQLEIREKMEERGIEERRTVNIG